MASDQVTSVEEVVGLLGLGKGVVKEMFDHAPIGMLVVDADLEIVIANPALGEMFERSLTDVVGETGGAGLGCVNSVEKGCGKSEICENCVLRKAIARVLERGDHVSHLEMNTPIVTAMGSREKAFVADITPLRSHDNQSVYAMVMISDVSDLRARNEELERLANAKDTLLRVVTHDLGSPMAGAFSAIESLLEKIDRLPRTTARDILKTVRDSMDRQIELLGRLLSYARVQTDRANVQISPVAVMTIIQATIETLRPTAQAKNVALDVEIDSDQLFAMADPELLMSVLSNLISNAIKFTPEGGEVTVGVQSRRDRIFFKVEDTGVGLSLERAEALASTGVARSTIGTAGETGTGLGMPFVVAVLEAHNSELSINSRPGEGTIVLFDLPVVDVGGAS